MTKFIQIALKCWCFFLFAPSLMQNQQGLQQRGAWKEVHHVPQGGKGGSCRNLRLIKTMKSYSLQTCLFCDLFSKNSSTFSSLINVLYG